TFGRRLPKKRRPITASTRNSWPPMSKIARSNCIPSRYASGAPSAKKASSVRRGAAQHLQFGAHDALQTGVVGRVETSEGLRAPEAGTPEWAGRRERGRDVALGGRHVTRREPRRAVAAPQPDRAARVPPAHAAPQEHVAREPRAPRVAAQDEVGPRVDEG